MVTYSPLVVLTLHHFRQLKNKNQFIIEVSTRGKNTSLVTNVNSLRGVVTVTPELMEFMLAQNWERKTSLELTKSEIFQNWSYDMY